MLHPRSRKILKNGADQPCIFVHAGAGYHSLQNERIHLQACNEYVNPVPILNLPLICVVLRKRLW